MKAERTLKHAPIDDSLFIAKVELKNLKRGSSVVNNSV